MSIGMISSRSSRLKLGDKYMRNNNPKFKAVYQDYDWCYERYVIKGMTHQEMADECGASLRVIQKWCSEINDRCSVSNYFIWNSWRWTHR